MYERVITSSPLYFGLTLSKKTDIKSNMFNYAAKPKVLSLLILETSAHNNSAMIYISFQVLPGPLEPPWRRRPSLKMTALSYSCTT